jgi:hypothetical protein
MELRKMESHGYEILTIMLAKIQIAAATFIKGLGAVILVVLLDSAMLIVTAYIMIALHVLSGAIVSIRNGKGWEAEKWFKTAMKFMWFPVVIVATQWMQHTNNIELPIASIVAGFLAVHDFKGLIDNVGRLTGIDIWNAIADHIDWKKFKIKKD